MNFLFVVFFALTCYYYVIKKWFFMLLGLKVVIQVKGKVSLVVQGA